MLLETGSGKARAPEAGTVYGPHLLTKGSPQVLSRCTLVCCAKAGILTKTAWQVAFPISQLYFEFIRKPLLEKEKRKTFSI